MLGLSPVALLLPLDRCFAWPADGSLALTASCLEWKSEPMSTDSCLVALEPRRVWASGRPVGAEPGERKYMDGALGPVNDAWRLDAEPERTQPSAPQ